MENKTTFGSMAGGYISNASTTDAVKNYKEATLAPVVHEVIEAAVKLMEWMPDCSVGSSGYQRRERLTAAINKLGRITE